ncbi:MAG: hypothetical protein ACLPLP_17950 [Mycobacterium sp.]
MATPWSLPPNRIGLGKCLMSWWRRRLAVETAMHRWDAQHAVAVEGGPPPTPLDADVAAAGIEEFVTEFLPGLLDACTDSRSGRADVTVRGTGSDVLLWLTNRRNDSVDVRGDRDLLEAWTRLKR